MMEAAMNSLQGPLYVIHVIHVFFPETFRQSNTVSHTLVSRRKKIIFLQRLQFTFSNYLNKFKNTATYQKIF